MRRQYGAENQAGSDQQALHRRSPFECCSPDESPGMAASFETDRLQIGQEAAYFNICGTISRGRNSDTSGQMISAASTSSIGISMITVSLSAKRSRTPAIEQAIIRQRP